MASRTGNTFQKISRTLEGVFYLTGDDAVEGVPLAVQ
jgi:hypothetical protein